MRPSSNPRKPYRNDGLNLVYDLLFCDSIELYKTNHTGALVYPWDVLFADNQQAEDLLKITDDSAIETRIRLLARTKLMSRCP
jgi:hypothetical protein